MSRKWWSSLALLALISCGDVADPNDADARLQALFEEEWEFRLRENPLFATSTGDHRFDDRLPEVAQADLDRRAAFAADLLMRLEEIDRDRLAERARIDADIFKLLLEDRVEGHRFRSYLIPILADSGFHINIARLPHRVPLRSAEDYGNYIARLKALPRYFRQNVDLMKEGLRIGFTQPQVILEGYETSIDSHVVDDPEKSVFFRPFLNYPPSVALEDRSRLTEEGAAAVRDHVVPAYREFLDFMLGEYRPGARQTIGASEWPQGREYYGYLIKHFTTLDMTADEIHQIGLSEVARIRGEMDRIIQKVGFKGDFAAFLKFLRTDPRFYAKSAEELLKQASFICKKMDGRLPAFFKTLPRTPYTVAPVPDSIAPKYTAGRYVGPTIGGTEPGYYWVNTYALESRPLYALEALSLHEAVPGHHLQNALRQELTDLPQFRRFAGFSAFGEGWGLYSERLGLEAGFYADPYSDFGRLTYEMWRACRLVVDTGLHAKGWTRRQAMDYMAGNTALSLHEIRTETDRYISWPGQALAYKLGELKIRELRKRAEEELAERFDIREFHDAVLLNGSIPLTVLEDQIAAHIRDRSSGAATDAN